MELRQQQKFTTNQPSLKNFGQIENIITTTFFIQSTDISSRSLKKLVMWVNILVNQYIEKLFIFSQAELCRFMYLRKERFKETIIQRDGKYIGEVMINQGLTRAD